MPSGQRVSINQASAVVSSPNRWMASVGVISFWCACPGACSVIFLVLCIPVTGFRRPCGSSTGLGCRATAILAVAAVVAALDCVADADRAPASHPVYCLMCISVAVSAVQRIVLLHCVVLGFGVDSHLCHRGHLLNLIYLSWHTSQDWSSTLISRRRGELLHSASSMCRSCRLAELIPAWCLSGLGIRPAGNMAF